MCSLFRSAARLAAVVVALSLAGCGQWGHDRVVASSPPVSASPPRTPPGRVLRVVADPNNLPFSNDKLEGFENRLADLIARDMGATVEYTWRAQRRGFFRHAFQDDGGDLVLGVPAGFERALTTTPYYRSTYVFVYRRDRGLAVTSLDDPTLHRLKIGVQIVGDENSGPPAAIALARRGLVNNIVGYSLYGDYAQPNPPARVIDAVVSGDVDVAVVWGPLAGYFAKRQPVPLQIVPIPDAEAGGLQFSFSISVGVKKGNAALRDEVNTVLSRDRAAVQHVLDEFGVPRVPIPAPSVTTSPPPAAAAASAAAGPEAAGGTP